AGLRRPKGSGKSPEGGYLGYGEFCLPTQFAGWTDEGQPLAVPHPDPWVQFAAVSEDQTDNVMVWLFDLLSSLPDTLQRRGIDLGRSRLYFVDRPGRIEPVTAAAGSREGQRVTFGVLDQSESWTKENGGERLAGVLRRNAAKMGGWTLELQNSPLLGDNSVADKTARAAERASAGVLFDTREPPGADQLDLNDTDTLREALRFAYGDAVRWVDIERLIAEIQDPDTDPSDARRYYLNVAAPSSDWAFDRDKWSKDLGDGVIPQPGELIVAGFDGARRDDSTAIVAVSVETGVAWTVGCWERPEKADDDWEVDELEVTAAVAELFERWQVWRMYCDPPYWENTVATWQATYLGPDDKPAVVPFWTNQWRTIGLACKSLGSAIRGGEIHHAAPDDDPLTRHLRNAVRRTVAARDDEGKSLWTLAKTAPGRKIDAAMALTLAWRCRTDAIAAGAKPKRRKTRAGSL
ncbi:MAG TPA: hypothetical protein VGE43_06850, partial [Acidimicrobiales bacterium]